MPWCAASREHHRGDMWEFVLAAIEALPDVHLAFPTTRVFHATENPVAERAAAQ